MGVEGGVPTRYEVTNRGQLSISPWEDKGYVYSISQLQIRSNSSGNLEVVSSLNLFNQAHNMYHYNYQNCTSRYYPKVYIGTTQTIAKYWNLDKQNIEKYPENWPENSPQKGEANRFNNERFMYFQTLTYIYIFFYNVLIEGKQ